MSRSSSRWINEERLNYTGSIVLGLNDALVELTGTLAGLTFALQNTKLTALAGLITGIAASFSMAASEYLSQRSEGESERASTSALYTGVAYICTVALLILALPGADQLLTQSGVTPSHRLSDYLCSSTTTSPSPRIPTSGGASRRWP